jgi:hypothetical protein
MNASPKVGRRRYLLQQRRPSFTRRFINVFVVHILVVITCNWCPSLVSPSLQRWSKVIPLSVNAQESLQVSSPSTPDQIARPRYTLEPRNFSVSYRQDVCERHEAFQNGTVQLADTLRGMELRPYFLTGAGSLALIESDGTILPNTFAPAVRVLDQLAQRAGFTWRDSYGASNILQTLRSNGTATSTDFDSFDPLLTWGVQSFDMIAFETTKTIERASAGNVFLEGYIDSSIIMVGMIGTGPPPLNFFSFFLPFQWQVWLFSVLTMVLAGLVYQWMEWINTDSDRQELGDKPSETVYFAVLSFFSDIKFEPSTNYSRLFVVTLAFWGMILSSAYTANLASALVARNSPTLQIETVGDAVAARMPLCILKGTTFELEVRKIYPTATIVPINITKPNDLYLGVLAGKCTIAITSLWQWEIAQRDSTANVGCQLTLIGRVFKFAKAGFAVFSDSGILCTNLIKDVLSLHISQLLAENAIDQILEDYLRSIQTIDCGISGSMFSSEDEGGTDESSSSNAEYVYSLTLRDLAGVFIVIYFSGAACCIAAMITLWRRNRRNRLKEEETDHSQSNNVHRESTVVLHESTAQLQEIIQLLTVLGNRMDRLESDQVHH